MKKPIPEEDLRAGNLGKYLESEDYNFNLEEVCILGSRRMPGVRQWVSANSPASDRCTPWYDSPLLLRLLFTDERDQTSQHCLNRMGSGAF